MIDFQPSDDQQLIVDAVSQFASATLAPAVRQHEAQRGLPEAVRVQALEMGLSMVDLPESAGGGGLGLMTSVLVEEELGYGDAASAFALPGPHAFGRAVVELAGETRAAELLAPFAPDADGASSRYGAVGWSEPSPNRDYAGFQTLARAEGDSFILSGEKAFVANASEAETALVFAQVDADAGWAGIGAFVVSLRADGVTRTARHDTLGLDAASFGGLKLQNVRVPKADRIGPASSDELVAATLRFFVKHGLKVAARGVGLSRFAFELAREHCENRTAFGKPIGHFQAVAFNLADRLMDVDSARWMVWRAAHAWDAKLDERVCLKLSAQATAHALEVAMRCADDCVQLHGGSGFIRDLVAEKLMRDAKMLSLCGPTPEQLDQLATAVDLGLPMDPALVLPTPDAQAIFV